jgi:hypothetical protein
MFRSELPQVDSATQGVADNPAHALRRDLPSTAAKPLKALRPAFRLGLRDRLTASAIHLALSAIVAIAVLALVLLAWYPGPMTRLHGVDSILLIMLGVDVAMGPLFTLIVFDRRKRNLSLDLATIAALQLAALAYGLHTVHQGRPAFVVLVKDRFEVVAPSELKSDARREARSNPLTAFDPFGPRWVAARMPDSQQERTAILFEAIESGRDVQHHPKLYVDYSNEAQAALPKALPIARLRSLNPQRAAEIDAAIASSGRPEEQLRYLPLRAPARDGAVLVDVSTGEVLKVVSLTPW